MVAQEVEEIFPELVDTDKKGFKSVDYTKFAPVLIEAVKEQQAIIEEQNKKIEELEAANNKLQSQIEEILKRLDNRE